MQKNIIITGASRGIGFELVKILSKDHQVLAISRNTKPLESIQNCHVLSADISKSEGLEKVVTFVKNEWKQVDIIIHNAGKLINKPFSETTTQDFLAVYQVNVFAVAELTRLLLSYLKKGSHVVNISSVGGVQGSSKFAGLAAYSSSKGAVITLTELLAEEYKEKGISFNALALGAVQTQMLAEAFPGYQANMNPETMANYIADFSLNGHTYFNGKVLSVANSTP
ncbi:MAG TPA: SDR family oxidoreductase [Lutibacter sp.]|nr:SDR family oxidoreductase [Lutibacter sp.]